MDLSEAKENSLTYEDFENNEIVFISDESHHVNSLTKKATKDEKEAKNNWEYSVTNAFHRNRDNIMLEFTATCDLKDKNVLEKYKDKIIFNYPLISFRESGYTKDFQNFATDTDLWTRALIALIMSEYRKYLFADLKLNIKPVVMLKSQKISDSERFYDEFFNKLSKLTNADLLNLKIEGSTELSDAIDYFKEKDDTLIMLEHSLKNSFTKETSIIMNNKSDNNKEKQLLVNSLEDKNNPIRVIFTVDMLNEGWDVLNLFDIVRLYDTRQGSGKPGSIGKYTIKEAQLIGRGARYCPFVIDDEELKYKRKYDGDLNNKNRILETMYFYSKDDSKYISELRQALIETGLQDRDAITLEYKLKDEFKKTDFYNNALVFSNKRVPASRSEVNSLEPSMRNKIYYYNDYSQKSKILSLIDNEKNKDSKNIIKNGHVKRIKFKDLDMNILLGAIDCFEELRFDILKEKYPNLKSKKEFLTSCDFLGNSSVEITYYQNNLTGKIVFEAVKKALSKIATHISSLKQDFKGTRDFEYNKLKDVLKDKKMFLTQIDNKNGGKGDSQNNCVNYKYRLDLSNEDWYVFNDNYGTSEEKLLVKYFKTEIVPILEEKELEYYLIRNERIPELAIYSFDAGERFEPDFILFVSTKNVDRTKTIYQGYIEPKGTHLIDKDKWKEDFMLKINNESNCKDEMLVDDYKIVGFPFFNSERGMEDFRESLENFLNKL